MLKTFAGCWFICHTKNRNQPSGNIFHNFKVEHWLRELVVYSLLSWLVCVIAILIK